MGKELVKEFDNLTRKFYRIFDDDLTESDEGSKVGLGVRSNILNEEIYVAQYYCNEIEYMLQ
jgi:hypothetical protein